jgi:hypothetical protein
VFVLGCSGPVTISVDDVPACADGWVLTEVNAPLDVAAITADLPAFVGSGFFILLPLWVAVYGGRAILNAIR